MRLRLKPAVALSTVVLIAILSLSWSNNPPNGNTGAPGDGLCSSCHFQAGPPQDGNITISGLPGSITGGNTYPITITLANPNGLAQLGGFQMVVLNGSNNGAGALANPSANSTITSFNGKQYFEHNPSTNFPASNMITWSVDWTAPAGPNADQITIYAAGNVANGNGTSSGDLIVTNTSSGTLMESLSASIVNVVHVSCFAASDGEATAMANAGTPPYDFAWSNGANTQTITNLDGGMYTVTVTDQDLNTAVASVEILEPSILEITNADVQQVSCGGTADGSIMIDITGGTPGYFASWSNGSVGTTISNLGAGDYTVTVTDDNGCTTQETYTIIEPTPVEAILNNLIDVSCAGLSDGSISVGATGGTGNYLFDWSNGDFGPVLMNVPAGAYTVTITDDNGCTTTATHEIFEPPAILVDLIDLQDVLCAGGSDGLIAVEASGGIGNLEYAWSNGEVTAIVDQIAAGDYTVTVTDANGCTVTATYFVDEPPPLGIELDGNTSLSCFGDNNGSLTATVSGGVPGYSYTWSNGSANPTIDNLPAGTYFITVEDANGCTMIAQEEVTEPPVLQANASATNETAAGANDGTAQAQPEGGTGPYTFLWSTGATTTGIQDLSPGTYSVTVTDANGCTAIQAVTVNAFGCGLTAEVELSHVLCFGDATGSAALTVAGNFGPVSVTWSNGDTGLIVDGLTAGSYSVTVVDTSNCSVSLNVVITQPTALALDCTITPASGPGSSDGSIACVGLGGTPPYLYAWSSGDTTSTLTDLAPGIYTLTVTDANGCTMTAQAEVEAADCTVMASFVLEDVACHGDTTGSAMVLPSNGTAPYQYHWSTGDTTNQIAGLVAGSYSVTITDSVGCQEIGSFTIDQPDSLVIQVDSTISASSGMADGGILISITGGVAPYEVEWYQGGDLISTAEDPTGLMAGLYDVVVIDANGCSAGVVAIEVPLVSSTTVLNAEVVTVWPNPVYDDLRIGLSTPVSWIQVVVRDGQGTVVRHAAMSGPEHQHGVSMRDLPVGIYFVQVRGAGFSGVFKVIRMAR
ncbi:MAG: choice-of-anchor V domain-containing protein [Saprospiraceae bacterium]|nr:choice-of-anchor V domain-containing protein [Saprospiraceae bacterium]